MNKTSGLILGLMFALAVVSGCGDKDDDTIDPKNLFSKWTSIEDLTFIDLTNTDFGTAIVGWDFISGEQCISQMTISGDQGSGLIVVSDSVYVAGSGAGIDPNCAALDSTLEYVKSFDTLVLCDVEATLPDCEDYI